MSFFTPGEGESKEPQVLVSPVIKKRLKKADEVIARKAVDDSTSEDIDAGLYNSEPIEVYGGRNRDPVMEALQRVSRRVDRLPQGENQYGKSKRMVEDFAALGRAFR
jgi:hypothetical protein